MLRYNKLVFIYEWPKTYVTNSSLVNYIRESTHYLKMMQYNDISSVFYLRLSL